MTPTATTTEPTLEEQVQGLKATAARLAAERDVAFEMASQATKDLDRERREYKARLELHDNLIASVRIDRDDKHDEIRRLNARVRELALANEDLQRRLDAAQRKTPERKSLPSWLSRRIGNQL